MTNYLTTDELVVQLNNQAHQNIKNLALEQNKKADTKEKFKKFSFKITRKKIFWLALILALIHIFSVSIPLLSENRGINAYRSTTLLAVPMNQEINDQLIAKVVRVEKVDLDTLAVGDQIILYGRYNTEYYWIEEIISLDIDQGVAQTIFDGVISYTVNLDDIQGVYIEDANLLSIISYVSSSLKGYIFMIGTYAIIFSLVYIFYIRKKEDKPIE
ncbi:MAG: hypothetical protein KKH01_02370 [Firmicutes bacterium]|nr:hypothetical protein [Bacillota bacterium]